MLFLENIVSTRRTIFQYDDDHGLLHVYEEMGYNSEEGPGFYIYIFRYGDTDLHFRVPQEIAEKFAEPTKHP